MRKTAFMILAFLFFSSHMMAQEGLRIMESLVMHSRILDKDVKYSVCLPEDYYRNAHSYPLVYMLHGLGDDETAWLEYGRISQYYDAEVEKGAIRPMIFIIPQGYRTYYVNDYKGTFLYQDMFIQELVPYIDSIYRTIPDRQHRGLIGYSMGGFGALVLHLLHPDIFGSAVPLSISIRTDEQYEKEDSSEWDEQWGRLFGAVGIEGPDRITNYYKQNNPFHIIPGLSPAEFKNFNIYIDNGDKEQTLCRSNEELHILMRNMEFPHNFRVREGGHNFSYWCSALPNALHFLSDAFDGKPYRGDMVQENKTAESNQEIKPRVMNIGEEQVLALVPDEFDRSSRLYPVLYMAGKLNEIQISRIAGMINQAIGSNRIAPMLVVVIPDNLLGQFNSILPQIEEKFRIRKGYRYRSMLGFRENAEQVCDIVMNREQFSSCILADGYLHKDHIAELLDKMKPGALQKTPFYIYAPDWGDYYEGNGNIHMLFRDMVIRHEYRVSEGSGGFDWMIGGFEEMLNFVAANFHR